MSPLLRRALLPFALLAPLALASCESTPREPDGVWASAEIQAGSERILLEVVVLTLERQSFPVGAGVDPAGMSVTTGWRNHLAPFRGQGYRQQASIEAEPLGAGRFTLRVRVKKQINQSIVKPLDLSYAEWEWVPDDEEMARILLAHVRSYFAADIDPLKPEKPVKPAR